MKNLKCLIFTLVCSGAQAQLTLKTCIDSGLTNMAKIKSAKAEVVLSGLKTVDTQAKYLPQISFAYEYRYNPIIATQAVPVGQFNPVPTDEIRGIQFGTRWQQNAGVTVYQPLLDFGLKSRIQESKLNEALAQADQRKAENELAFEIIKAYSQVLVYAVAQAEAVADTVRSFQSLRIIASRFEAGNALKTELNDARINHHANVMALRKALAALINEKIYLSYVTSLPLPRLLDENFAAMPPLPAVDSTEAVLPAGDPDLQRLDSKENLLQQQLRTERKKYTPTVGVQGFVGANQFTQELAPVARNTWFGNSYIGLSVKLPLFASDKSYTASKQLRTQLTLLDNEKDILRADKTRTLLEIQNDIQRLQHEIDMSRASRLLQEENVAIYRDRLAAGQYAAMELNTQEAALQKISYQLMQLQEALTKRQIEQLYTRGALAAFIQTLP